jgi:hypothetical protein
MNCEACKAKDEHIKFLQKMIEDLMEPFKPSTQTFVPRYVNDLGEMVDTKPESDIELVDIELNGGEDEKEVESNG